MKPAQFYTVMLNSQHNLSNFTVVAVTTHKWRRVWGRKVDAMGGITSFDITQAHGQFDTLEAAKDAAVRLRETGGVWQQRISQLSEEERRARIMGRDTLYKLYPTLKMGDKL